MADAAHLDALQRAARGWALSPRQTDVLRVLADGRTNKEIAATLEISPYTAAQHVAAIMRKAGVANRTELVSQALRE